MPRCSGRQAFELRSLAELERLATELELFGERHCLAPATLFAVNLALEEVVTNALSYGYDDDAADHLVDVELCITDGAVVVTVQDDGRRFDPLEAPVPDVAAPVEERAVGGLGMLLVRKMMDEVTYARANGRNVLTLKKQIAPSGITPVDH